MGKNQPGESWCTNSNKGKTGFKAKKKKIIKKKKKLYDDERIHSVADTKNSKLVCRGGAKMAEEQDGENTFFPKNSSKEHLNTE